MMFLLITWFYFWWRRDDVSYDVDMIVLLMFHLIIIPSQVQEAKQDLIKYQREKQRQLNDLDVIATLNYDQLKYLKKG